MVVYKDRLSLETESELPVKWSSAAYLGAACVIFACGLDRPIGAQELPREIHPWGRFETGAWKIVRGTSESLSESLVGTGEVLTTDSRTTLEGVDDKGVTLRLEVVAEVAGKRFRAEPQTIRQGIYGEPLGDQAQVIELGEQKLTIQGREFPCRVAEVRVQIAAARLNSKLFYTTDGSAMILRRESRKTDLEGRVLEELTAETVSVDIPCKVGSAMFSGCQIRTVQIFPSGNSTTLAVFVREIPGGIVCQTTKEFDEGGRLVRRTSLELVDYGLRGSLRRGVPWRWPFAGRRIYRLPPDWIEPGLLPDTGTSLMP
ncbi:hypothetical protein JCM17478_04690 [Thermopirellula anaerolimosa]